MLFMSRADTITKRAWKESILAENVRRKAESVKKLDYYNDCQSQYIVDQIQRTYTGKQAQENIIPVSVNAVKKIVRALSMVYLEDATRTLDNASTSDTAILARIEDEAGLPTRMKLANRYSKLLGTVLLRPVWRNGKMDLDVLTPDVLDVLCGDTVEQLEAVTITHAARTGRRDEVERTVWTAETVERLDYRGGVITSEENPYKILPFVPVFSTTPTADFWQAGAADLVLVQDAINARLSDLFYVLRFQSFGVGWTRGGKVKQAQGQLQTLETGPGSLLVLPENGEVGFAQPNAPIEQSLAAIDFLIKQAAITNGLSAASVSTDPTEESGISKIVGNSELLELRRDDVALFARYEDRLFQLFRTVWNTHNPGNTISENAVLRVDFHEPAPTTTPLERLKEQQALLEMGLASHVDVLIERNPDLSRDAARAKLLEIRDEIKEFQDISLAYPA